MIPFVQVNHLAPTKNPVFFGDLRGIHSFGFQKRPLPTSAMTAPLPREYWMGQAILGGSFMLNRDQYPTACDDYVRICGLEHGAVESS